MKTIKNFIQTNHYTIYNASKGIAIASLGVMIILSILLLANYFQLQTHDPLNQELIGSLLERLEENPNDHALREQIRGLDLLARKAFFTSYRQIRMGSYLLLICLGLFVGSMKLMNALKQKEITLSDVTDDETFWLFRFLSRKWMTGFAILLFFVFILSLSTPSIISQSEEGTQMSDEMQIDSNPDIWANFRGPGGNGIAVTQEAPIEWNAEEGKNIKWVAIPPKAGFGSPVVWQTHLYVTGGDDDSHEVYCFSTETGALIWTSVVEEIPGSSSLPEVFEDTGYAPSTVAAEDSFVCAIFPNGDLICLTHEGEKNWAMNLGLPDNHYGHASSLLIHQGILFVQYDQNVNARLLAYQVATGDEIWQVKRKTISWSSPICVNTGSKYELILTNSKAVHSYDPKTGLLNWENACLGGEMGPSATYSEGMVFVANEYAVAAGLRIHQNQAELVWEYDEYLPDTASPLATGQYVFLTTSYGVVVCLEAKTGKFLWEHEFDDGFYASPILIGDLVYALDLQGQMHIFKADKTYQPVGTALIGEASVSTPAFVGNRIYIRGFERLYCVEG